MVPPEKFYMCMWEWINSGASGSAHNGLAWTTEANPLNRKIYGNRDEYVVKRIANAGTQGV